MTEAQNGGNFGYHMYKIQHYVSNTSKYASSMRQNSNFKPEKIQNHAVRTKFYISILVAFLAFLMAKTNQYP